MMVLARRHYMLLQVCLCSSDFVAKGKAVWCAGPSGAWCECLSGARCAGLSATLGPLAYG